MKMYFSQSSRANRTLSEKEIERNALLSDLEKTKKALEVAYAGFDNVTEPDLIDCYIYEVQSVQMRYQFLLGRVKQIEDSYAKNPLELSESGLFKPGNLCCFPDRLNFPSGCSCHK